MKLLYEGRSYVYQKNIIIRPLNHLLYSKSQINLLLMIFIRIILVDNYFEKNYWNNNFQSYLNYHLDKNFDVCLINIRIRFLILHNSF